MPPNYTTINKLAEDVITTVCLSTAIVLLADSLWKTLLLPFKYSNSTYSKQTVEDVFTSV